MLAAWAAAAVVCLGTGLWVERALRRAREARSQPGPLAADDALLAFWLGFAALLLSLALWHLFLPVSAASGALALAVGAAGLWVERARLLPLARAAARAPLALLLSALLLLWWADLSLAGLRHYDTGLYLLGGVGWATEHRALPGLGNLHGRFAFNNAHLLYAALFEAGPWAGRAPNVVNGSLVAVWIVQCVVCARRLWRGEGGAGSAFACCLAPPVVILASVYLVSFSSDLPATLLCLVVAWRCFRLLVGEAEGRELAAISLLAAAAIAVKLSAAVFVAACWVLAVVVVSRRADGFAWRPAGLAALLLALALAPWLVRGVVLSGYPLYPSAKLALPVEWRVAERQAVQEAEWVRSWARVPGAPREATLDGWYWLPSWGRRHLRLSLAPSFPLPLLLGFLGVTAAAIAGSLGRNGSAGRGLALLGPGVIGFAAWFWLAPDPRFAMFVFWSIAATGVAVGVDAWGRRGARAAALGVLALVAWAAPRELVPPGPRGGFHAAPRVPVEAFRTESGLVLHVPAEGDQCWDAPRPCTPYPRPDLRLRRAGDPGSGFLRRGA